MAQRKSGFAALNKAPVQVCAVIMVLEMSVLSLGAVEQRWYVNGAGGKGGDGRRPGGKKSSSLPQGSG